MTVENTFGRWKGRFRRFLKHIDMAVASTTYLVAASCILHNICEFRRDDFLEQWLEDAAETVASSIRDALALFFRTAERQSIGSGHV